MGKKKKKGKARCQHTGPREDEWETKSPNDAPTPVSGKHTEFLRSLFDRMTLEHIDEVLREVRTIDPEGMREVMYVHAFMMKFTRWEKADICVFLDTELGVRWKCRLWCCGLTRKFILLFSFSFSIYSE